MSTSNSDNSPNLSAADSTTPTKNDIMRVREFLVDLQARICQALEAQERDGPQLNTAMQAIQETGCGAILYLRQEGRGIGLTNKIRAYALQDQGHDTLDANLMLGLPADARVYDMCSPMLAHVGVDAVRLITNNPDKVAYLTGHGINVVERVPLVVGVNDMNADYLATKRDRMGHLLDKDFNTALHLNK